MTYTYRHVETRDAKENVAHSFEVDDQRRDIAPTASQIVARQRAAHASTNGHGDTRLRLDSARIADDG